jgi:hypothetical protein
MTTFPIRAAAGDGQGDWPALSKDTSDAATVLGVVREDIRQTLQMGWIDPALDAVAVQPVFFTAAWSAMRPNVGKSFLLLARALRTEATESVRLDAEIPDLRKRVAPDLSDEELTRIEECVKAAHLATVKVQIVTHAFYRAIRRDHLRTTGREEAPVRRGVPDWQRWMSFQPAPSEAQPVLDEAAPAFGFPTAPGLLRLLARWPAAVRPVWEELRHHLDGETWRAGAFRLRRSVLSGIQTLPHPIEPQWPALHARGFKEAERAELTKVLAAQDAAMPAQSLTAAFLWLAFGAPDIGSEGRD